ncbi:hypothetical protein MPTK1_7g05250 [Marchantia polymorpha subsp. ruderalis]|uniref:Macro domain-containing protein n=2 Tax=Marchantia polymorpha TaxID=3197 RepID=A0AAF6BWC5_MARPO|nr:hypothetical protein MARPO_0062s0001 [Marchantia polymorpha]BBN16309.1 hypothetical protein Mp_7g05250 [Marchantia polymorpha subsp. ruderalis]|eukprot:PTQ36572.1 hypothetical protein MARPO_0062s0001 [Marchantia polymorpha]
MATYLVLHLVSYISRKVTTRATPIFTTATPARVSCLDQSRRRGLKQHGSRNRSIERQHRLQRLSYTFPKICKWLGEKYVTIIVESTFIYSAVSIHASAGPELKKACLFLHQVTRNVGCPIGEARIKSCFHAKSGSRLKVSKIIHTELRKAYRSSMALAVQNGVKYIAFPAISCGLYQYPLEKASVVALSAVREGCAEAVVIHFLSFLWKLKQFWKTVPQQPCKW